MFKNLLSCTVFAVLIFLSCKKEPSYTNKAPVANAGKDTTIQFPVDSVALDGSSSYDPDGTVEGYLWRQIAGPATADIVNTNKAQAKAKHLVQGVYSFELTVTDSEGASSKDTIVATVLALTDSITANAGPDQLIALPVIEASLDASRSRSLVGLPLNYQWRQISGSASQINNTSSAVTSVLFSVAGVYQFELKVWNTGGVAYDTTRVTVNDCVASRTEVPAQLTHLKQFSFSSYNTAKLLAVGNKLIIPVDVVDPIAGSYLFVYDVVTGTHIVKELDFPRFGAATVVAGNKVFFAGGFTDFNSYEHPGVTNVVDIYDAASDTWSTAKLSQARAFVKAATVGNKVVFAGGLASNVLSNKVDIYDVQTNQWTTSEMMGERRAIERVVTNQQSIYFLGGYTRWDNSWDDSGGPVGGGDIGGGYSLTTPTRTIDIYNVSSGGWSTANMEVVRTGFSAVSADDKIIIAGGMLYPFEKSTSNVEIIALPTMQRSNTCLAKATAWYSDEATAMKNGSAIFYLSAGDEKRKFNIYNPQTGAWSLGVHNFDVLGQHESVALASINNQVYVLKGNSLFKLEY